MAAAAICDAWDSEISPARNASAVSGSSSNWRAVSSERIAVLTLTPVADASQCAADRWRSRFQNTARSTRRASRLREATTSRSARVNRSIARLACATSSVSGSSRSATRSKAATADSRSSNTFTTAAHLPEDTVTLGKQPTLYRTHVRGRKPQFVRPPLS